MFHPTLFSRRDALRTAACGFGYLAFASLAQQAAAQEAGYASPVSPKAPHFSPRAKRVIFLFMQGAPSHVDTFDYKPKLQSDSGKAFGRGKLMASPFQWRQHGQSGLHVSDLFPNLATCDNVDDLLMIDPRPGNATSNDAADNIAVLTAAIAAIPGSYRRRVLVRLDGAGFSHKLLEHIATGGGVNGRSWEFSVGWSCTDREIDAIAELPDQAWTPAIEQNGEPVENAFVADLTGLLDLKAWQQKIPGLRVLVRDEPLHPRYRTRATDREKALGRRFQLIVVRREVALVQVR